MKKHVNPSWLSADVVEKGLTPRVVNYLSGKLKTLDSVKNLTWEEFFFIYFSEGAAFAESNFFKNAMQEFVSMKNNKEGKLLMQKIHGIIRGIPESKDFFRSRIPVTFAMTLCEHFWQCAHLWEKAKTKNEQRLILDKCLELFATCKLERDTLKSYWNMTTDFPEDRRIVQALIGGLIALDTYQAYLLAKEIPFTENQMTALVEKISTDKTRCAHTRECLMLYGKTRNEKLIPVLEKFTSEETNPSFIFGRIAELIDESDGDEREFIKKTLFPLLDRSIRKMGLLDYLRSKGTSIINYLPKYQSGDSTTEGFLDEIIKYYGGYEYRLTHDAFLHWYEYAPKGQFINLYLDGFGRYGVNVFRGAIQAFEACKNYEILETVIKVELPILDNVNEDLLSFVEWLEKEQFHSYYEQLEKVILENNLLGKWLAKVSGPNKHGMIRFLKLAVRFK